MPKLSKRKYQHPKEVVVGSLVVTKNNWKHSVESGFCFRDVINSFYPGNGPWPVSDVQKDSTYGSIALLGSGYFVKVSDLEVVG